MVQQPEEGPNDLERFVDAPEPGASPEPAAGSGPERAPRAGDTPPGREPALANGHAAAGAAPGAAASNGAPLQSRGRTSGVSKAPAERRGVDLGGLAGGSAHGGYDSDDSGGDGLGAAASVSSEDGSGSEEASGDAEPGEGAAAGGNGGDRGDGSAEGGGNGVAPARRRVQDGAYDMQKRCSPLQQEGNQVALQGVQVASQTLLGIGLRRSRTWVAAPRGDDASHAVCHIIVRGRIVYEVCSFSLVAG